MRLMSIQLIFIILLYSCNTRDYYTILSPDESKCATFEYSTSMMPNDSIYVKMYLGHQSINKDQYIKMLWSNIGGVAIDWGASPIKVRSWLIKKNTIPSTIVDAQLEMTKLETEELHKEGSTWVSYDFTWISSGKYRGCEAK